MYEELTFTVPRTVVNLLHTTSHLMFTISLEVDAVVSFLSLKKRGGEINWLKSCSGEAGANIIQILIITCCQTYLEILIWFT